MDNQLRCWGSHELRGRAREVLDAPANPAAADLGDVTVLIPARNESKTIAQTLGGVFGQGPNLRVILVDDQSTDNTVEMAHAAR